MKFPFLSPANPAIRKLSPVDAVTMVKRQDVTLLDVRDASELSSTGRAKGALHIPLFLLKSQSDPRHPEFHTDLSVDKPVLIYCASGARSGMAAKILAGHGFSEIYNIGSLHHWTAAGGKVSS